MRARALNMQLTERQIGLFYLGQMGFLIKFRQKYILVDPYLSDYVDQKCSTAAVRWERNYPPPAAPEELDFVDYVFCTHNHPDHADPWTLERLTKVNPNVKIFAPIPMIQTITAFGINDNSVIGMGADESIRLDEHILVKAIPAAHEELHCLGENVYEELGYIFSFGKIKLYHAGDCCPYVGLEERIQGSDIMICPVNGRDYFRRYRDQIIGCFNPEEAVTLAINAGVRILLPAHLGLYDINTLNPAQLADCVNNSAVYLPYHMFAPGEAYIYDDLLFAVRSRNDA